MTSLTTALIYARVSSEEQASEGLSIPTQLADCRRYVAAHPGWVFGAEYLDVLSGRRDDRPEYQRLLADVRALRTQGVAVVVIVWRLDRFGRRLLERVRSREELKTQGVPLHSVREGGEVSDLVANILASIAEEEVRQLSERLKGTYAYLRDRGFERPGKPTWGYRLRPATELERAQGAPKSVRAIDEATAPYVREAFRRMADGESARSVGLWAAQLPETARGGRKMWASRVYLLLKAPVYIARFPDGRPGNWPALIDEPTWTRAQAYLATHRQRPHQATGQHLLTGFIRCPRCGGTVGGTKVDYTRHGRYAFYLCTASHRGVAQCSWTCAKSKLDGPVVATVAEVLVTFATQAAGKIRRDWRAAAAPGELEGARTRRLADLKRQAEQARGHLTRAAQLFVEAELDRAGYELLRDRYQQEIAAADAELARLGAAPTRAPLPSLEIVLTQVASWAAVFREAAPPLQRQILAQLVDHVEVTKAPDHYRYQVAMVWTELGERIAGVQMEPLGPLAITKG